MTPVKVVRPATKEDDDRRIRAEYGKYKKLTEEVKEVLEKGTDAIVEINLGPGEKARDYQFGLTNSLKRGGQKVGIYKIEPKEGQSESEITFRIKRKEGE